MDPMADAMTPDPEIPVDSCDPPLIISPDDADVIPFGSVVFSVTGGTGDYQFSLSDNQTGATLNQTTGIYISGDVLDAADRILVSDRGCQGTATASIRVISRLQVTPRDVEMGPGTGFTFSVSGGSGAYECSFINQQSGGTISPDCAYAAGATTGVDIVRVRDTRTGDYVDADLSVRPDAALTIAGAGHIFIPLGQTFAPTSVGGSGYLDPTVSGGSLSVQGRDLRADAPGRTTVRFTDRYTSMTVDVPVTVVAPFAPDVGRDGERTSEGVILSVGDLDGDGYHDAVLGHVELSVGAHYSGAVMVYAGTSAGLAPTPVQIFGGSSRFETLGRDIAVADINRDGQPDLLIGADHSDQGSVNNGALMIHHGVAGGFFTESPSRVLHGENSSDSFGSSVAACDFDGDGYLDIAVGAVDAEDRNVATPATGQGAVHVFKGSASGYSDRADFILYGEMPTGDTTFTPTPDMNFGHRMRAGDLDGDGRCDLAVAMPEAALDGSGEDGLVLIYQGTVENNLVLTRSPVRTYAPDSNNALFGWNLAIDDINSDGADDLVIAQYKSSEGATQGGAVRIYMGGALDSRPPGRPVLPSAADWIVTGDTGYEYLGQGIALDDFDGDPYPDLVVGAPRAEDGSPTNSGAIRVYRGTDIAAAVLAGPQYDATTDAPAFQLLGNREASRLGQAVGVVGQNAVIGLAGFDDTYGIETGAPYYGSVSSPTVQLLDLPGEPAGHAFGTGLTLFDVDGDGDRDLVLGGPGAAVSEIGGNSGMLFSYRRESGALTDEWTAINNGYVDHDAGDRFGTDATAAGDFNGDGIEDLAVVARGGSRPSSFGSEYANPSECPGSRSRSGSVLVFLGSPSGLESQPAFVFYGLRSNGNTEVVRGGFDHNGDGYDDLVVGGRDWSSSGGFAVVHGRAESASGIRVLCSAEDYLGVEFGSRLGDAVAPLGDIDGDGCDEVAIGAPRENLGVTDQGVVRIKWGWGGSGCASSRRITTMVLTIANSYLGSSIDGGRDVDGDGVLDMVVGGTAFTVEFARLGGAWVIPGSYLLTLPRQFLSSSALPSSGSTTVSPILPERGDLGRYGVVGPMASSEFGRAIALIPDPLDSSRGAVAVGMPLGNAGGVSFAGGVAIYRWQDSSLGGQPGLGELPYALFAGETALPSGTLGATLEGHSVAGVPTLLVGAPLSNQTGLDLGAGYVLGFE